MSDPKGNPDPTDESWDHVPSSADEKPESGEEHRADTVPPPASGDAYSADTVIRDVPREALDAIRERKRVEREAERSSRKAATDSLPKLSQAEDDKASAKTVAAHVLPDSDKPPGGEPTSPADPAPAPTPSEEKKPHARAPAQPAETKPHVYKGPPPVTSGELWTAVACAVIAIIAGFYLISSAF